MISHMLRGGAATLLCGDMTFPNGPTGLLAHGMLLLGLITIRLQGNHKCCPLDL